MEYEVYWGSGSPVSWRVLLAFALKRVQYRSHRLDLSNKEHRSEEYRALSPRGAFPILRHNDLVVRDSMAILVYLDRVHPDPPLFGRNAEETAKIWETIGEHQDHLGAATETITRGLFRKNGLENPEPVIEAVDKAGAELRTLDERLGQVDWVAGPAITAADVVHYPTLHRLLRAAATERAHEVGLSGTKLATDYPNVEKWNQRLTAMPGVAATYPPHWK